MIDVNNYVVTGDLAKVLELLGITKAITSYYAESQGLKATHQVSSVPIDGIFLSSLLEIEEGDYFLFRVFHSDYRVL